MGTTGPITPPFPASDTAPSSDQAPTPNYTPASDVDAQWQYIKAHADEISKTVGAIHEGTGIVDRTIAKIAKVLAYIVPLIAQLEAHLIEKWTQAEAEVYSGAVAPLTEAAASEASDLMAVLLQAMAGEVGGQVTFSSLPMGTVAQQAFTEIVQPFSLVASGLDPSQPGSGVQAQSYLLSKAMSLALQEWIVAQLGDHMGMGFFKTLSPFLGIIDHSLNPANVVRQAMESSYQVLLKTPLTRDLNRLYPVKKLGATALAKAFIRNAIDETAYLNQCLDLGLSNDEARNLLAITAVMPTRADVAKLLNDGYLTQDRARAALALLGYDESMVDALIYLDTHQRFFTLQERVGGEAVTAWKKGFIDQPTLEQYLQQLGYTSDEITLLEIEGKFTKQATDQKELTYSQIKELFKENLLGIDAVITFLQNQGYSPTNVELLVLLDFTSAEQRKAQRDAFAARLRVQAEQDRVAAISETAKGEAALAAAKKKLADELDTEASALGTITQLPGALTALGF